MAQEHERAAGAWHAEQAALPTLCQAAGAAVAGIERTLGSLVVHPKRMRENLGEAADGTPDLGASELFISRAVRAFEQLRGA